MEHYSATKRNAIEPALVRWMNLEPVIQSEVKSEREEQIVFIDTYIRNLEKSY